MPPLRRRLELRQPHTRQDAGQLPVVRSLGDGNPAWELPGRTDLKRPGARLVGGETGPHRKLLAALQQLVGHLHALWPNHTSLRFTVTKSRRAYLHPATHYASANRDPNLPPMGLRLRLKRDYGVSGSASEVEVILRALKTYGMFVADNGSDWFISGAPDSRWRDEALAELRKVKGSAFEVIYTGDPVTNERATRYPSARLTGSRGKHA